METTLSQSERCKLFERIAEKVWKNVIKGNQVNFSLPEIGLTAGLILNILHHNKKGLANFDVYAKKGWKENIYGSDIDVFVETGVNKYRWFALQAKVLKSNNRYDTLRDTSDSVFQWDKLSLLEAVSGCKSYHLLYNGKETFTHTGTDQCNRVFTEKQFGCSIVEPNIIKHFALRKSANGRFINPTFEDIHPKHAEPWRVLTCCYHDTSSFELYSIENIKGVSVNFKLISNVEENLEIDDEADIEKDIENLVEKNNPIDIASREAKWNPGLRIIIHRTDNLEERK